MRTFLLALTIWCLASATHAATLLWDAANTGPLTIERGTTPTGPFTWVATVPSGTTQFILTPGAWGHYRVTNSAGSSNTAQYSLDLYSGGLTDRLDAVEGQVVETVRRVEAVEADNTSRLKLTLLDEAPPSGMPLLVCTSDLLMPPTINCYRDIPTPGGGGAPAPTPASNFTTRIIDLDHLEITGTACASMATTGSGTRRVVECRH